MNLTLTTDELQDIVDRVTSEVIDRVGEEIRDPNSLYRGIFNVINEYFNNNTMRMVRDDG